MHYSIIQAKKEQKKKDIKKYTVKPPKDLRSKYELKMEARRVKAEEDAEEKLIKEQEALQLVSRPFQPVSVIVAGERAA